MSCKNHPNLDIRQSLNTTFKRKHLTTRKDLQNITRVFGITLPSKGSVLQNDETSVCAWVYIMESQKDNPVLFSKRQEDPHAVIDQNDFMLVLMTNFQKCIMYRLGADRICVDSTHGISNCNFELVVVRLSHGAMEEQSNGSILVPPVRLGDVTFSAR
ncbi:hypothetical protein AVEN_188547-1 [Araneus ventricosus]|uniref:Uncharacterized protein n=1 Tax=Araneus ventricosus TaxID=182803 RepID=A0A4Y2SDH2_ARAVE|nr:hypothetical protein AVEN_188547-1 [Araneus ventricosus]